MEMFFFYISARLTRRLLRHNAVKAGLSLGADGYVDCQEVVEYLTRNKFPDATHETLHDAVAACPKQRFELSEDRLRIRACQGHSIRDI